MALLAAASLLAAPGAGAQEFTYSGSLQYATGAYVFADRTHSAYFSSGLSVRGGRFELGVSVPLIFQNSQVVSYVRGGPVPTGGSDHGALRGREPGETIPTHGGGMGRGGHRSSRGTGNVAARQSGGTGEPTDSVAFSDEFAAHVGDPFLRASAELFSGSGPVRSIRISGGAKAPVADLESGVGTGEWDYQAGASVALSLAGVYVFGDMGWWWLGDLPDLELRDGPSYGVGAGHPLFGGRGSALVTVTGARSSIATVDAPVAAGFSLGYTIRNGRSVSAGMSAGLTESSPDLSIFLGWTLGL